VLSDDRELAELNARYMNEEGPTDVLSFPLLPAGPQDRRPAEFPLPPGQRVHLGDIVVSVERAIEQAAAGRGGQTGDVRWSAVEELRLLAVHGALHICGLDHDAPKAESDMRNLELQILSDAR
jgi:probable rRNA maturation factor